MDKEPKLDGRHMTMFLSRKRSQRTPKSKNLTKEISVMPKHANQDPQRREEEIQPDQERQGQARSRLQVATCSTATARTTKRKRGLRAGAYADKTNEAAIKRMIPYK